MSDDLSIVIPAYNESKRIIGTIAAVRGFFDSKHNDLNLLEVIVVSDGSGDDTVDLVKDYIDSFPDFPLQLIELSQNFGKGYAVKTWVGVARGAYILFMDADLSTPLTEISKLRRSLDLGFGVAIDSMGLPDSEIIRHQARYRELMGKVFNLMVRLLVIDGICDTQCGFKLFRADVAKLVFRLLQSDRFDFDVEVLLIAQELGFKIVEVPVIWQNSTCSTVSPLRDAWQMFLKLVNMKRRVQKNLISQGVKARHES